MHVHLLSAPPARQAPSEEETLTRWSGVLTGLGHRVSVSSRLPGAGPDALLAMSPVENAGTLATLAQLPDRAPLAIVLNGLDPAGRGLELPQVVRALAYSDALVVFHEAGRSRLTRGLRARARIVPRPALPAARPSPNRADTFEVASFGSIADSEPVPSARVARALPGGAGIQVLHAGAAQDERRRFDALRESETNPAWRWLGAVPRGESVLALARARILLQLGPADELANPITEALAAGVGVLATREGCNVGLLGEEHPGLVAVGDLAEAARRLAFARTERRYLQLLRDASSARAERVQPAAERRALRALLQRLGATAAESS